MYDIVSVSLDNEMDLILAHKRTMKLSELCGQSVAAQTTFATAVSEIARCAIGHGQKARLSLSIDFLPLNRKEIIAEISDDTDLAKKNPEAISYARRLMGQVDTQYNEEGCSIILHQRINFGGTITQTKINLFKEYFRNEPPVSPYDEIRKKNIQLIELTDKLKESETQYRLLTDTLPLQIFAINHKGEVTYSNKGLRDYLGTFLNISSLQTWQNILHPDDVRVIKNEWDKSLFSKTIFKGQARLKHKEQNRYIWHLISIVPLFGDKDIAGNWIGFFVDIHAQKLIEETLKDNKALIAAQSELKQYQSQLEGKIHELNISNHDLEQFAYIASHDLQEPLRKIKTFSNMLEKQLVLDAQQQALFNRIHNSSDRMSALIKDVLNYSRLSNPETQIKDTDLNEVLQQVIIDFDLLIHEKNVTLNIGELPLMPGIERQMLQLFSNLVSNAIKFSKENLVITITCEEMSKESIAALPYLNYSDRYYHITFADNGIGIEQIYAEQIFTIFQRLNGRHDYSGTGIGLAMCRKIVVNHHGVIKAEGQLGVGTTFHIYFPFAN